MNLCKFGIHKWEYNFRKINFYVAVRNSKIIKRGEKTDKKWKKIDPSHKITFSPNLHPFDSIIEIKTRVCKNCQKKQVDNIFGEISLFLIDLLPDIISDKINTFINVIFKRKFIKLTEDSDILAETRQKTINKIIDGN